MHDSQLNRIEEKLGQLLLLYQNVNFTLEKMMATQAELAKTLTDVATELKKVATESATLIQTIADLKEVISNGSAVTPELQEAVDAVAAQARVVDDLVPEPPTV